MLRQRKFVAIILANAFVLMDSRNRYLFPSVQVTYGTLRVQRAVGSRIRGASNRAVTAIQVVLRMSILGTIYHPLFVISTDEIFRRVRIDIVKPMDIPLLTREE